MTMFARLIPALRLRLFGPRKAASLLLAFIAAVSLTGCAGMRPHSRARSPRHGQCAESSGQNKR